MGPASKSLQALINDELEGGGGATQSEVSPFKLRKSNSTSPLENWNLTVLSKVTAGTVMPVSYTHLTLPTILLV